MEGHRFSRLNDLPPELRIKKWRLAIDHEIQDTIARLPRWFERHPSDHRERRRQAFAGVCPGKWGLGLVINVFEDEDSNISRYRQDDYEALVHSISLAAVSQEVRRYVAEMCICFVKRIDFTYASGNIESPDRHDQNFVVRDKDNCVFYTQASGRLHLQPRPSLVILRCAAFGSATTLVKKLTAYLGPDIESIYFDYTGAWNNPDHLMWPGWELERRQPSSVTINADSCVFQKCSLDRSEDKDDDLFKAPKSDRKLVGTFLVTDEGGLHVPSGFAVPPHLVGLTYIHQLYDIFQAAKTELPRLKSMNFWIKVHHYDGGDDNMNNWHNFDPPYTDSLRRKTKSVLCCTTWQRIKSRPDQGYSDHSE